MARSNLAYDFSRYDEQREREAERRPRPVPVPVKKETGVRSAVGIVVAVLFCLAAMIGAVYSDSQISSVHAEIVDAKEELEDLRQENRRMMTALEEKSSQKAVEEYAEKVLGMQKLERSQTEYVNIESGNHVEISGTGSNIFEKISDTVDGWFEKAREEK
ncbi:MAG: cell division protein FtsL [Oscillospiraceae bacterium]|nr:cell division protein FtsL [Oscillospiraceae bacterium]